MTDPAVRAMLEARSVAVVGASDRPGGFGSRLVSEVLRSPSSPEVHLVNPGRMTVHGRPCVATLADVPQPVDLVLLGVGDASLEKELTTAAERGDRAAVVFGSAWSADGALGARLAAIAREAGMALCGGGCMGFVNVAKGLRAIGYLERPVVPAGPVALVSHSGSAFSALLRSHRRLGFSLAVSSGQELVTTAADYVDYALDLPGTEVVALLLETVREPVRLRAALARASAVDVPVVLLAVGTTGPGGGFVEAHSGALAGADATWEALSEAHGLLRVEDLDELADLLELLGAGRRCEPAGRGIATVHDSGAERVLVADVAHRLGVPFAPLSDSTVGRLSTLLDPGLAPANPLDVWGSGADTRELTAGCLSALADDPAVSALALSVDLVEEYDRDDSYPLALLDVAATTGKPLALLSNMASALDPVWAGRLRAAGVPVLEGTRSGLRALGRLVELAAPLPAVEAPTIDVARQERWVGRLRARALSAEDSFALLRDYGLATVSVETIDTRADALAAARRLGLPVVLKTAEDVAHKSDVGGVLLGLADEGAVAAAYDEIAARLGPRVLVSTTAPAGVELSVGVAVDPLLGPTVVVAAGGVLVEVLGDRAVALPPLDVARATRLVDRLRVRPLLDGVRGAPAADLVAVHRAVVAMGLLASELGDALLGLDVNPLVCGPGGAVAADVLVVVS